MSVGQAFFPMAPFPQWIQNQLLVWALGKRLVIEDDPEASVLPRRDEKRGMAYVGSRNEQTHATIQKIAVRITVLKRTNRNDLSFISRPTISVSCCVDASSFVSRIGSLG